MRYSRRARKDSEVILFKAIFAGLVVLALALGGVANFASALLSIVIVVGLLAFVGVVAWLIQRSLLLPQKKMALFCLLASAVLFFVWTHLKDPIPWIKGTATVTKFQSPQAVTVTDYTFTPAEAPGTAQVKLSDSREWPTLDAAEKYTPPARTVYYDPKSPANSAKFSPVPGWKTARATVSGIEIRQVGEYSATVSVSRSGQLFPLTASITTSERGQLKLGAKFPAWVKPNSEQFSFEPRNDEPIEVTWMIVTAFMFAGVGTFLGIRGRQWMQTPSCSPTVAETPQRPGPTPEFNLANRMREIDWFQFEKVCETIMRADGWSTQMNGGAHADGGVDIIATKNGLKAIVQCKHYRNMPINPAIVRELLGAKNSVQHFADYAILFTLSPCTIAAKQAAAENRIQIMDSDLIMSAIERVGLGRFPSLLNPDAKECPKCGAAMIRRDGKEGQFWGCSTFPRCRGKFECFRWA